MVTAVAEPSLFLERGVILPQALIFDMDGLLVDTETCDYEAWRELHAAHGH